jgi:hypothetical protein
VLRLLARKNRVGNFYLIRMFKWSKLDAGRVDQRPSPGELKPIHPLLQSDRPRLFGQCDVFAVVDRQLNRITIGQSGQVDILGQREWRTQQRAGTG